MSNTTKNIEEKKSYVFAPNAGLVKGVSFKDSLLFILFLSLGGIFFTEAALISKIIIGVMLLSVGTLRGISIIYSANILKNPLEINPEENKLLYFDEFTKKRKFIDIQKINKVKIFYKNNRPYILEMKYFDESKNKEKEENVTIEAFDNSTIDYFSEVLKKCSPKIEFDMKFLKAKKTMNFGKKTNKKSS
jgi:hypothetical protein